MRRIHRLRLDNNVVAATWTTKGLPCESQNQTIRQSPIFSWPPPLCSLRQTKRHYSQTTAIPKNSSDASTAKTGYQSLGSFHSDHLGALMSLSDQEYQPPPLPFDDDDDLTLSNKSSNSSNPFDDFMLDRQQFTFLNHGAFGAALKVGYQRADQWRYYLEQQPLRYFDRDLLPHLAYATRRLVSFCSTTTNATTTQDMREGTTLIQNVTSGLNSVLKGYKRVYGDRANVIVWDTSYGSLKKLALRVFGEHHVTEIPLQSKYLSPLCTADDPEEIFLQAIDETMSNQQCKQANNNIEEHYLLVLDHTTSNTAISMPIERIAKWAKDNYGDRILVLVDGAHGLLAQDVNLERFQSSGIDFYLSNGHKWLSCPRGVGMLYGSNRDLNDSILAEPAIVSHGVDEADLLSRFVWDGTRDYAAALAVPAVLDYWETLQPGDQDQLRAKLQQRLFQGIQILCNHWHAASPQTDWLDRRILLVPPSLLSCSMALVRLPDSMCGNSSSTSSTRKTSADAKAIQDFLYEKRVEVPIKCINGELYVRVSCHVYNELDDFERLGKVLLTCPSSY